MDGWKKGKDIRQLKGQMRDGRITEWINMQMGHQINRQMDWLEEHGDGQIRRLMDRFAKWIDGQMIENDWGDGCVEWMEMQFNGQMDGEKEWWLDGQTDR